MKIYCMSDIHGCLAEFEQALSLVSEHMEEEGVMLLLLGDYIHGGQDNIGVLDKIISIQNRYGSDKVVALMGNHEEFVLVGDSTINHMIKILDENLLAEDEEEEQYVRWMENLPRYYVEGNTIFVHAGIDEEAGDMWEWGTGEDMFVGKYPAETGKIQGLDMKVVAGHVGTAEISGDPRFHDIYYDGESHYYIDGTVLSSGMIPVLMVDTDTDKYYRVTETGNWLILPYEEENG
ncbi:MAG: metallophosphoesterase [Lachnospiraceae bacterium]|nr:metallophosphoesterase [Lachnospiraceae bacterium]